MILPSSSHVPFRDQFLRSDEYLVNRRIEALERRRRGQRVPEPVLAQVIKRDNLFRTFERVRSRAGQAVGPDGLTYWDFSGQAFGAVAGAFANLVKNSDPVGFYLPREPRCVQIPKSSGGTRTIQIKPIIERVGSFAVNEVISPILELAFDDSSYAYRPSRCHHRLLARVAKLIQNDGYHFIAKDDIVDAFGSVRICRALQNLAHHITDEGLLTYIGCTLRGHDRHEVGIAQGNAISPDILNIDLTYVLDRPSPARRGQNDPRRFRFADDLIYLFQRVSEGLTLISEDRRILSSNGYQLKGTSRNPINLNRDGSSIEILGTQISLSNGTVRFEMGKKVFNKLASALERVHETRKPVLNARTALNGWMMSKGMVFESRGTDRYFSRILDVIGHNDLWELASRELLSDLADKAVSKWRKVCDEVSGVP